MKKINILLSAALMFFGLTAKAQTTITFDTEDYKEIGVYDMWEQSPFRTGVLEGNAAVANNPSTEVDAILGEAPNTTDKVVAFQRSRHASNTYGVRIDLKEPIRVTKQLQYIHIMTYLKDKPADSRMMVIGLGKRLEESWNWQTGKEEQFWAVTAANVKPKAGWQDVVVEFKGFSYAEEEKVDSGINIHSLVIVPDVRSPHADEGDWVAYFDQIVVDGNPAKRFTTQEYALSVDEEATIARNDRYLNEVGLTVNGKTYKSESRGNKKFYTNNTIKSVFSATAGAQVQPTFNYAGNAMHGYVYVDWGNDGLFKDAVNANGTPAEGSDVVSYSAADVNGTWVKSDGTASSQNNHVSQGVPSFTIPANTPTGFYRMRYKVDWNSLNPAGNPGPNNKILDNGGCIVDLMLDVHGDQVTVNASQLNGDIVLASDGRALQNHKTAYEQPLTVKIIPEKGFVQYGFTLKYGHNVNGKTQLDEHGNPNWIQVHVPYSEINADSTYTIPAEYLRGSQVSIAGDMQQEWVYTVKIVGAETTVGYGKTTYKNGDKMRVSQFFSAEQLTVQEVEGFTAVVSIDKAKSIIKVAYKKVEELRQIASLSELSNDKFYHIKAKSGEGYWAWNTLITDKYISLRGMTTTTPNGLPSNEAVAKVYQEEVNPFDETVVWQFLLEDGKYYLYQPAKKEYVTRVDRDYVFTTGKVALDAVRDNGDGTFGIHAGGNYSDGSKNFACIVTNEASIAVRNWTWDDHGAVLYIVENPNIGNEEEDEEVEDDNAVEEIVVENEFRNGIYNLQGQKLDSLPASGIVIVNNKKLLVK